MTATSRFIVLGTAGHIDHGKTSLVRLLTGTDTDRLKEEKARGISIDLGFAHLELPGGISCGVVDVPGHERFVKNMLAGACGVDAMVLVVAADEGIMPQTREHLDILDLLGVKRGIVALTKIDMVEADWLELVTASVAEYLDERGFGHFPIVPVSTRTGEGKEAVLQALAGVLAGVEDRPASRSARLPIDRAFVVEGFGTVVTGTLWRGTLRPGERVVLEPGGVEARIRNVEVHGETVTEARAGQRTAVALPGVSRESVPRGTWILEPGILAPALMLDVRLRVLEDAGRPLKHRERVRFHLGSSETLGRVFLLEGESIAPGESGLAQMRLEAPVVADREDRFVLRSYSPARAIAGGIVILPRAPKRRRQAEDVSEVHREESGSAEERLVAVLAGAESAVPLAEAARRAGLAEVETQSALAGALASGEVMSLDGGGLVARSVLDALVARAEGVLSETQRLFPLRWGVGRGELKSRLGTGISPALFDGVVAELQTRGRVSTREDRIRLGSQEQVLPPDLARIVRRVEEALEVGGKSPPVPKELQERLGFAPGEALEHLTFKGGAVKVSPELYLGRNHFQELLGWLDRAFARAPELTVSALRDAWGMSRKYSVPLLEYLDREGWTRRVGDVRVRGRRWAAEGGQGPPPVAGSPGAE
jgi:selenocysteine-specific elongation factor